MDELQQLADEARAAWEAAQQALVAAKVEFYAAYPDGGHAQQHAGDTPELFAPYVVLRDAVRAAYDAEIVARGKFSEAVHALQQAGKVVAS